MKSGCSFAVLLALASGSAVARDEVLHLPINAAIESPAAKQYINADVKFFFGRQSYGKEEQGFREDTANHKVYSVSKGDEAACQQAFLEALGALAKKAQSFGANAVVDIRSYYRKETWVSDSEYECHAALAVAGVAMKGRYVRLR